MATVQDKFWRQWDLRGLIPLRAPDTWANGAPTGNSWTFSVQPGALIESVDLVVDTAWDSSGATLTATDGTNVFLNGASLAAAAHTAGAASWVYYPNGGTITLTVAVSAAATVGHALVSVKYAVEGRANESFN